ncbi:maleylpyruvate isomerase family mycothiol-dependent enzyme [Streptomyces sp. NPDC006368]|uniref:maleylpyruvate isomerase family mycothiol-dependent enzyme n=1 Tax=Streptomyces sp. NPDC006368 TaxID=3156760 RepID=UPI0033A2B716
MVTTAPAAALDIPRTLVTRARSVNDAEVRATVAALAGLAPGDWARDTACAGWTVRDVAAHVVGQFEELPRPWLMIGRVLLARRRHPRLTPLAGHNQCQVDARRSVPPDDLIALLRRFGRQGVRGVDRVPAGVRRRIRLSPLFPESKELAEDSMDYLARVLIARDTWMHRVDICDATGQEFAFGSHDGEIVGQVLLDLALRWSGPPVLLDLGGPVGGRWALGRGAPAVTVHADAVTLMRHLSGRPPRGPLDCEGAVDAAEAVRAARVAF